MSVERNLNSPSKPSRPHAGSNSARIHAPMSSSRSRAATNCGFRSFSCGPRLRLHPSQAQNNRKALRCHAIRVSGLAMASAER